MRSAIKCLLVTLIVTACTPSPRAALDITVSDQSSPSFTYLLEREAFASKYTLIKYVLYQRTFRVDEANPLAEILEQNIIISLPDGHRISIDQYIDRYIEPPPGEPKSDYMVPIHLTEYYALEMETGNLAIFSTICCSEADQTTCQLIATHDRFVIHIDILTVPAIGQAELLEILTQPIQAMDQGL